MAANFANDAKTLFIAIQETRTFSIDKRKIAEIPTNGLTARQLPDFYEKSYRLRYFPPDSETSRSMAQETRPPNPWPSCSKKLTMSLVNNSLKFKHEYYKYTVIFVDKM